MTTTASPSDGSEPDKPVKPTRPKKPKKPKLSKEQELLEKYAKLENFPELFLAKKPYGWVKEILAEMDKPGARVALRAANGCLGGEQEVYDPVAMMYRRVDAIDGPFHVYAWDEANKRTVVAKANEPFTKPADKLYSIEFANGRSIVCSGSHRFLTPDGWFRADDLPDGSKLLAPFYAEHTYWHSLPASTSGTSPSASRQGVGHWCETDQGSQADCQRDPRLCGEPLHPTAGSGQSSVPSPSGAPEHTAAFSTACHPPAGHAPCWIEGIPGDPGRISVYSPIYQPSGHPANCACGQGQNVDPFGGSALHVSSPDGQSSIGLLSGPSVPTSGETANHASPLPLVAHEDRKCHYPASVYDFGQTYTHDITTVVKRRLLRVDTVWDFEVPVYHNYVAEGVVHHNSGKTSEVVAPVILHFLINYPGSQVVVTAGVYRQISEVLWPVLRNLVNGMGPDVAECFSITENRIKYTAPSEPGQPLHEPALCNGFSADKPESAEGWHARPPCHQLLYIIDEAKAVPDGIFDAMERCQPTRVLEVSSPGARAGRFFERFNKADGRYKLFQVTAHDCPHIKKEWIDQQVAAYGLGSQVVQSMVFAEFGDEDGASLVLTPGVLQRCISSPPAPQGQMLRAGCDFAAGGDENVIQILEGNRVKATITWREKDTMAAVGRFITEFKRHGLEPSHIWADNGGIGIPMCDALHEAGWTINRVNNGEAAYDSNKFANRGTEMWVQFARQVELGKVILPKDDILHRQLTTRRLEHNSKGKLMVEPKPKMKDRGLDSPDRADALILAMCGGGMSMEEYMVKAGKRVSFGDIEVDDMEGIAGAYAG